MEVLGPMLIAEYFLQIWSHLLYYDVALEMQYYERKEFLKVWKNNYVNRVGMTESSMRSVLVEGVALKHIQRLLCDGVLMTATHKTVLLNLLDLATCDYKPVRNFNDLCFTQLRQNSIHHCVVYCRCSV